MDHFLHPYPTLTDDKIDFSIRKLNIPESNMPRVVIAGGGFAGITLASKLKNAGYQVVLLDKNNYHTFQPLLYQVATAGLEPDSIAFPIRKILKEHTDFHFRMANIIQIDSDQKEISTDIGKLKYDIMVLATGSKTHFMV
jgi:NADH dehydrogenase